MRQVKMPTAEIDLSADLVAALIQTQHPDLAAPLRRVANGLETVPLDRPEVVRRHWDRLVETPVWSGPPLWLHGDPHPGNVLIHEGTVSAVIDFGDLTAGDPATDLALAWPAFDQPARQEFRNQYTHDRSLDADTWTRARGWALCLAVALIANSDDEPVLAVVGRHALDEVLADDR